MIWIWISAGFIGWLLMGVLVCAALDKEELYVNWMENTQSQGENLLSIMLWPITAAKIHIYYGKLYAEREKSK